MTTNELHMVFLLIGFGIALWHTWVKGYNRGYDEGYFYACDQVARGDIKVTLKETNDDNE
jgi:hypothetical protein